MAAIATASNTIAVWRRIRVAAPHTPQTRGAASQMDDVTETKKSEVRGLRRHSNARPGVGEVVAREDGPPLIQPG